MKKEKIEYLPIGQLEPFKDHPFRIREGEEKENLKESIRKLGTIEPIIVRPSGGDKYEVISGHRRLEACTELGIEKLPVIIRELTDRQAAEMMVDGNLHRENLLPSEKAFAYKMKQRHDVAENISTRQIQRYIRLTHLIPEILIKVDEGRIALTVGAELSYLTKDEQNILLDAIELNDCTPSHSQAIRLKNMSREGSLDENEINKILSELKPNQKEHISFSRDELKKYYPKSYTEKDIHDDIIKILEQRRRIRDRGER